MNNTYYHLLIVDDLFLNIHMLDHLFRNEGYAFSFATSSQEVFKTAQKEAIDLILLDVIMPEMDGYQICQRLKRDPKTKDIPVIFLTSKTGQDDISYGFECGAVDYVTKPYNSTELVQRVRTHLDLRRARQLAKVNADNLVQANERLAQQAKEMAQATDRIADLERIIAECNRCNNLRAVI